MRSVLAILALVSLGCRPSPEFSEVQGLWGRVEDGEHQVWEFARELDVTGLEDVIPAFRRWEYPLTSSPREMARGRWNLFGRDVVITPSWSLVGDPESAPDVLLQENTSMFLEVDRFTEVELLLLYPGEEEPRVYVRLSSLPDGSPD